MARAPCASAASVGSKAGTGPSCGQPGGDERRARSAPSRVRGEAEAAPSAAPRAPPAPPRGRPAPAARMRSRSARGVARTPLPATARPESDARYQLPVPQQAGARAAPRGAGRISTSSPGPGRRLGCTRRWTLWSGRARAIPSASRRSASSSEPLSSSSKRCTRASHKRCADRACGAPRNRSRPARGGSSPSRRTAGGPLVEEPVGAGPVRIAASSARRRATRQSTGAGRVRASSRAPRACAHAPGGESPGSAGGIRRRPGRGREGARAPRGRRRAWRRGRRGRQARAEAAPPRRRRRLGCRREKGAEGLGRAGGRVPRRRANGKKRLARLGAHMGARPGGAQQAAKRGGGERGSACPAPPRARRLAAPLLGVLSVRRSIGARALARRIVVAGFLLRLRDRPTPFEAHDGGGLKAALHGPDRPGPRGRGRGSAARASPRHHRPPGTRSNRGSPPRIGSSSASHGVPGPPRSPSSSRARIEEETGPGCDSSSSSARLLRRRIERSEGPPASRPDLAPGLFGPVRRMAQRSTVTMAL